MMNGVQLFAFLSILTVVTNNVGSLSNVYPANIPSPSSSSLNNTINPANNGTLGRTTLNDNTVNPANNGTLGRTTLNDNTVNPVNNGTLGGTTLNDNTVNPVSNGTLGQNASTVVPDFPYKHIRLPKDLLPLMYNIWLQPDLKNNFTFSGRVKIRFQCHKATKYIILHSKDLNITSRALSQHDNETERADEVQVVRMLENKTNSFILFEVNRTLNVGWNYTLILTFDGKLSTNGVGFYKEFYTTKSGETRNFAVGFLAMYYARHAFPCFDEPEFKAKFQISIAHPKDLNAVSNMPLEERIDIDNTTTESRFQTSPLMSTYLVEFIISDFIIAVNDTVSSGKEIRVLIDKEHVQFTKFALEVAEATYTFYENYTGIPYPLPKLDLAYIPKYNWLQASPIGYEAWGLISFTREPFVADKSYYTQANYWLLSIFVAHEMAHMWFGDLVTVKWWNDVWLYQGTAFFMQFLALDSFYKTWNVMDIFVTETLDVALVEDTTSAGHILRLRQLEKPNLEIIYLDYVKTASLLRMLMRLLGPTKFQRGIQVYLHNHKFGNADGNDLWNAFSSVGAGFDVKGVMDGWLDKQNYPLIEIKEFRSENVILITQCRFMTDLKPSDPKYCQKSRGYYWHVPLYYITSNSPDSPVLTWMNNCSGHLLLNIKTDYKWIKVNAGQTGVYRVNYDERNWDSLIEQLWENHTVFSSDDRYGLLSDSMNLADAKRLSFRIPLNMTLYLRKDRSFSPFAITHRFFDTIWKPFTLVKSESTCEMIRKYIVSLTKPMLSYLGWDDSCDNIQEKRLRARAVLILGYHGEPEVVNTAWDMFQEWMQYNKTIRANLREYILMSAIKYRGEEEEWDFLWNKYQDNTTTKRDKGYMLSALAASRKPELLERLFNYTLDENKMNSTDVIKSTFVGAWKHRFGRITAWNFLKNNVEKLVKRIGDEAGKLYKELTSQFNQDVMYNEVEELFEAHVNLTSPANKNFILEKIRKNIEWLKPVEQTITDFMGNYTATIP